jgi:hypothetical protein
VVPDDVPPSDDPPPSDELVEVIAVLEPESDPPEPDVPLPPSVPPLPLVPPSVEPVAVEPPEVVLPDGAVGAAPEGASSESPDRPVPPDKGLPSSEPDVVVGVVPRDGSPSSSCDEGEPSCGLVASRRVV